MIGPDEVICTWLLKKGERGKKSVSRFHSGWQGICQHSTMGVPPNGNGVSRSDGEPKERSGY